MGGFGCRRYRRRQRFYFVDGRCDGGGRSG